MRSSRWPSDTRLGGLGRVPHRQDHLPGHQRGDRGQQHDQRQAHADQHRAATSIKVACSWVNGNT